MTIVLEISVCNLERSSPPGMKVYERGSVDSLRGLPLHNPLNLLYKRMCSSLNHSLYVSDT